MTHRILSSDTIKLEFQNLLMDIIATRWSNECDSPLTLGRDHDMMFREQTIFVDSSKNIALRKDISNFDFSNLKIPYFCWVKRRDINTLWHEYRLCILGYDFKRSLNSVKNLIQDARTQFNRQGLFGSFDRITNSESGWIFKLIHVS